MTTPTIADYLNYANLQMAAEAFLFDDNGDRKQNLKQALIDGNKHASRFTAVQAEDFLAQWDVIAQCPNTPTGFSGTLFQNKVTKEYVISFRSTEFIDDAVNDTQVTNKSIKDFGWGYGQIADMEEWYASIASQISGPLTVTGYSLGGHLATTFNLLRQEGAARYGDVNPIVATYTYNGAGVGQVNNGTSLGQVMQLYNSVWNNKGQTTVFKPGRC